MDISLAENLSLIRGIERLSLVLIVMVCIIGGLWLIGRKLKAGEHIPSLLRIQVYDIYLELKSHHVGLFLILLGLGTAVMILKNALELNMEIPSLAPPAKAADYTEQELCINDPRTSSGATTRIQVKYFSNIGDPDLELLVRTLNDLLQMRTQNDKILSEYGDNISTVFFRLRGLTKEVRNIAARAFLDPQDLHTWCKYKSATLDSQTPEQRATIDNINDLLNRGLTK